MRAFATFAVALIVAVSAAQASNSYEDEVVFVDSLKGHKKCPGKFFTDGCNTCSCLEDGVNAACTLKACLDFTPPRSTPEKNIPVVYGWKVGQKCPAPVFYDNCNKCWCSKNGVSAACTKMGCGPPVVLGYQQGTKCPAQFFFDNCNQCRCGKDGYSAACSKMGCPPRPGQSNNGVNVVDQPNNGVHVVDLPNNGVNVVDLPNNDVHVVDQPNNGIHVVDQPNNGVHVVDYPNNGVNVVDNHLPVVYGYVQGTRCPAPFFIDICNQCRCSKDGHSASCTKMGCGPRPQPRY